jgi:alginate O-acetyltransferase complex protein AlgI
MVPTKNIVDVALYILFFPQLVAGPIVRATDLLPQMREARSLTSVKFKYLLALFWIGYFKKSVISDNLAPFVDQFFVHPENFSASDGIQAMLCYAAQIYCDFSGYTDMAIATAGLLGFQLKPNLIAFWHRWHMSLSYWLRDYLYIPLGGSHRGPIIQARNLIITMLLGGLWHGASWTFVIWGGLHGIGLVICRAWQSLRRRFTPGFVPHYSIVGNFSTFIFVCFAWIFFRSPDFQVLVVVLKTAFRWNTPALMSWDVFVPVAIGLLIVHVLFYNIDLDKVTARLNDYVFGCAYGAATALILPLINAAIKPFIYFQF